MAETITKTRVCTDCSQEFQGRPRAKRCNPCRDLHRRTVSRERMRAWRAARPKASSPDPICEDCGISFERTSARGRVTKRYCDSCLEGRARANTREHKRRKRAEVGLMRRTCLDCPDSITGAPGRTARCKPCGKEHRTTMMREVYLKAYRHVRRAWRNAVEYERFSPLEIYNRDGWRCGVCRKQISKKLRHPDLMSVSLDHRISLSRGGPHTRANTQPAHLRCNIRKNKYDALPGEQIPLPIVF